MAGSLAHRHQTSIAATGADVDKNEWNDTHIAAGGVDTQFMQRDSTQADGWKWAYGKLIQNVNTQVSAVATGGTAIPIDDTIPQNTEGDQFMSLSITPVSALNTLMIDVWCMLTSNAANWLIAALFQDSTANALAAFANYQNTATGGCPVSFRHTMLAGTTSLTTFKVRGGRDASAGTTVTFNGAGGVRIFGGVVASSITIREFAA